MDTDSGFQVARHTLNFKTGQGNECITSQYQVKFGKVGTQPQPTSHSALVLARKSLMVAEYWQDPACEALVRGAPKGRSSSRSA